MATKQQLINQRLDKLAVRPFRARFKIRGKEAEILTQKGLPAMREHAQQLLNVRLFPAQPFKDGKQTPYRGHPVFVAQHATATCCRTCLERWHFIPLGKALDELEQQYVLDVLETYYLRQTTTG